MIKKKTKMNSFFPYIFQLLTYIFLIEPDISPILS